MPAVNPNRMELLKQQRRLRTATRGHDLLKSKLDALMKRFLMVFGAAKERRARLEAQATVAYGFLTISKGEAGSQVIDEALAGSGDGRDVQVEIETILTVQTPRFKLSDDGRAVTYSLATTPAVLDDAIDGFTDLLEKLVEAAQDEKALELLAFEIDRTRRRVNALEHILIPQVEQTIKSINMSLAELERANLTRIMKIKEIIAG